MFHHFFSTLHRSCLLLCYCLKIGCCCELQHTHQHTTKVDDDDDGDDRVGKTNDCQKCAREVVKLWKLCNIAVEIEMKWKIEKKSLELL